jgi:hypothetical protein
MEARETHRAGEVLKGVKAQAGQKFFSFKHTHAGAADAVLFAGLDPPLPNMKNVDYRIILSGESTESAGDAISIDESSIATTGFSFVGGTAAEISHVFVHGDVDE